MVEAPDLERDKIAGSSPTGKRESGVCFPARGGVGWLFHYLGTSVILFSPNKEVLRREDSNYNLSN